MKLAVLLLPLVLAAAPTGAAAEQCWADWRCKGEQCKRVMGGWYGSGGPLSSMSECEAWKRKYITNAKCRCSGGGSPSSGGGGTLQEQAVGQMVEGMMKGNVQQFNMGTSLLGAQMLGQGLGQMLRGDPAAAARAEAARQAAAAEAARRAAEDKRRFEAQKSSLLEQMDGPAPDQASGGGSTRLSFKDDEMSVLSDPPKKEEGPKDDCSEALASHERAMGEARSEAEDFNAAIVRGHFEHGKDLAGSALSAEANRLQNFEWEKRPPWENKSAFGGKLQYKDHELTFDQLMQTERDKTWKAAAGAGMPKKKSLLEATEFKDRLGKAKEKVVEAKDWASALRNFHKDLQKCRNGSNNGQPDTFDKCLDSVSKVHSKVFEKLKDTKLAAAAKRVKAARDSYHKYVGGVMAKNDKLMKEALCSGR